MKIEKDFHPEDRFQLHPCLGADLLHHRGSLANHDRLLRLTLHDDRRVNLDEVLGFVLFESIDGNRCGVRKFVRSVREHFLANDLRDKESFRLGGELLGRIERRSRLQILEE